ncbi:TIGR02680 family protein [Nocardia shimofusensis]|uniref:TIGR02680 family protein n=1 Tax=Nocardia shimofusensis TaxID=228596 RepID=UPI00083533BB|nr:TIGR02680 family protein [Nocardia shimofusensis]
MSADPVKHFDQRWRLARAGVVNVWQYLDTEFALSGGRLILRGANGSGKSRALEMLLPFLLDADRRRMDATGSQKVSLDELMRTGARGQTNRVGYLWLELARPEEFLTLGAYIKYSASTHRSDVHFFLTGKRVGEELVLLDVNRDALSRDRLREIVGADNLTDAAQHRENVRARVFGLHGEADRDRFTGLIQLLHTLRSPDVGNRIDEGKLPQILSDALPPLDEQTLESAGERLDGLTATRLAQQDLARTLDHVRRFHAVYSGYAAGVFIEGAASLRQAAEDVDATQDTRDELAQQLDELREKESTAAAQVVDLTATVSELDSALTGLRARPLFAKVADLEQRQKTVASLRGAAEQASRRARRARDDEHAAAFVFTAQADELRAAVEDAATALSRACGALAAVELPYGRLPASIGVDTRDEPRSTDTVMDSLDQAPTSITRPSVSIPTVFPEDLDEVGSSARDCGRAAGDRRDRAGRREQEARRLDRDYGDVRRLEDAAESKEHEAQAAQTAALEAATARDDLAVTVNRNWRTWIESPVTARLMPDVDRSHPTVALLLSDTEILCGDAEYDSLLDALADLATDLAQPTRDALTTRAAGLRHDIDGHEQAAHTLRERQYRLEAEEDPEPPTPPWQRTEHRMPLWRAIDFRDEVDPTVRAGIEGALLASGLLTAALTEHGELLAEDGEILLRPAHSAPASPLSRVLCPDPAVPGAADRVERVLAGVGWEDDRATTSISGDGRWRNGTLCGRHFPDTARHIGATARAAARHDELARIGRQLTEIAEMIGDLQAREQALRTHRSELDTHLGTAPRSRELVAAREAARTRAAQAAQLLEVARSVREQAARQRAQWSAQEHEHRELCEGMALPADADSLAALGNACETATRACAELDRTCHAVQRPRTATATAFDRLTDARARRSEDEDIAEQCRRQWSEQATELTALREALDLPLQQLEAEIEASERERERVQQQLRGRARERDDAAKSAAAAVATLEATETRLLAHRDSLRRAAELCNARLHLPGLRPAAVAEEIAPVHTVNDSAECRQVADSITACLRGRKPTGVTPLLNALTRFGADTSGHLEVSQSVEHDTHLVHIEGAEHHHSLPDVLKYLEDKVERGRQALTEREREVFTEFVLGSITDELRRRVRQAGSLVDAMNASLCGTRTSHGIGVRISWELDSTDQELRRLMHLVGIADQVRSEQDNDELVALVRERVDRLRASDSATVYATHLRQALDYRAWHTIEVTILGPGPNQTRRISRRAKISQGETRFVSYVTLFAAADGYLSGLPDADHALRLVLLDDAFAKVDERAIGELMGLLVRLDIDFVMTGHALWGTVGEVPALDIYEIRRIGDSCVVPTHIHWDGHKRTELYSVGRG